MHAAGVWHEQSRPDRDNYITIQKNNISCPDLAHNFDKHLENGIALTDYDYKSIMHYSAGAFAKPGTETIICNPLQTDCPSRFGGNVLTSLDKLGLNRLYPFTLEMQGGNDWGQNVSTVGIQFGDIDGDGMDEVGVIRKSKSNNRIFIYDDAQHSYKLIFNRWSKLGKWKFSY